MKVFLLIALATMGFATAQAQDSSSSSSTLRVQDVAPAQDPQADIDKEITNAKMRAYLGSKSRWSMKSTITYNGSSIDHPGDAVRPDYVNGSDPARATPQLSNISGAIGIKYALAKRSSLTLGTGVQVNNPLQGDLSRDSLKDPRAQYKGRTLNRTEVQNPYLEYAYATKTGELQLITDATASAYTNDFLVNKFHGAGDLTLSQFAMTEFGTSGWTGGVVLSAQLPAWSAAPEGQLRQYDLYMALSPFTEYAFNDRYSFRTVFNWFGVQHFKDTAAGEDGGAVVADAPAQSVGIGIAITRDIYFYPNVQFTPFDIRSDRTNVALQTNLNIF